MTRPREKKKSRRKRNSNPGSSALEADAVTTRPTRRWGVRKGTSSVLPARPLRLITSVIFAHDSTAPSPSLLPTSLVSLPNQPTRYSLSSSWIVLVGCVSAPGIHLYLAWTSGLASPCDGTACVQTRYRFTPSSVRVVGSGVGAFVHSWGKCPWHWRLWRWTNPRCCLGLSQDNDPNTRPEQLVRLRLALLLMVP